MQINRGMWKGDFCIGQCLVTGQGFFAIHWRVPVFPDILIHPVIIFVHDFQHGPTIDAVNFMLNKLVSCIKYKGLAWHFDE